MACTHHCHLKFERNLKAPPPPPPFFSLSLSLILDDSVSGAVCVFSFVFTDDGKLTYQKADKPGDKHLGEIDFANVTNVR